MKKFFSAIGNLIRKIYTKWVSLDKTKRLFSLGILCLILIGVLLIIRASSCDSEPVVIEMTPTPIPTMTPAPTATLSPTPTATPTPTPSPTPTPDLHPGEVRSRISGEWLDEAVADKRPYAVMFNNLEIAAPQSGIGEAVILYEALSEAGITRLMGIFENLTEASSLAERIGSVRSARHYFVSFADEYDAIFIHYGRTTYAEKKIKKLKIDHLDGTDGIGSVVYYRDNTIKAPHNAFASLERIQKGIEQLKIRTDHEEGYEAHYKFYESDTIPSYKKAVTQNINKITLGFSAYTSPYLLYDKESGLYVRYQFGDVHTDFNTGNRLEFKNVIIQLVEEWNKDKNGYQTMDIEDSEGSGYYFTNGKMTEITWKKNEKSRFMRYYDVDGEELTINTGKTFIALYPNNRIDKLIFE